jgi:hypothetical protein
VRYALTLADWAQQRGDSQTAIAEYQRVLGQQPTTAMRVWAWRKSILPMAIKMPPARRSAAERRRDRFHQYAAAGRPGAGRVGRYALRRSNF